jgi:hypothetical protein
MPHSCKNVNGFDSDGAFAVFTSGAEGLETLFTDVREEEFIG